MSRTTEDAVAEKLAAVKPWQVLVGTFVEQAGVESVVDVGGARITVPSVGATFALPNEKVRLLRTKDTTFLLGPASPRSTVGIVTAGGSPRCTVEYPPGSGVTQLMGYPTDTVPDVDDLVLIDWGSGGTVSAIVTATPEFETPPDAPPAIIPPGAGRQTVTFTAIDSGTWNASSGWWNNEVWASNESHGAWFYGSKIRDTIPDTAVINSVEVFLPAYSQVGSPPNFRLHTSDSKPGSAVTYTGDVMPLTPRSGWVVVPTTVGDFLKANVGGTGMRQGGYNRYRGVQADGQSGALRITYTL